MLYNKLVYSWWIGRKPHICSISRRQPSTWPKMRNFCLRLENKTKSHVFRGLLWKQGFHFEICSESDELLMVTNLACLVFLPKQANGHQMSSGVQFDHMKCWHYIGVLLCKIQIKLSNFIIVNPNSSVFCLSSHSHEGLIPKSKWFTTQDIQLHLWLDSVSGVCE